MKMKLCSDTCCDLGLGKILTLSSREQLPECLLQRKGQTLLFSEAPCLTFSCFWLQSHVTCVTLYLYFLRNFLRRAAGPSLKPAETAPYCSWYLPTAGGGPMRHPLCMNSNWGED